MELRSYLPKIMLVVFVIICNNRVLTGVAAKTLQVNTCDNFISAFSGINSGDSIVLTGGTYRVPCTKIEVNTIRISVSGSSTENIFIGTKSGVEAVFDFGWPDNSKTVAGTSVSSVGFDITGDYLYFKNITITKAGYQGAYVTGSHITFDNCIFRDNWNSGLEINKGGAYVTVLNCDAYRNFDSNYKKGGMADGFASKQTQGAGNRFIGCRAWENSDDGYDTYDSPELVTFEKCWAFRNGVNVWNYDGFDGNGNGFKVGGNFKIQKNVLKNCIAFGNVVKGFDQNNNSGGITVVNCISYSNGTNYGFVNDVTEGEKHIFKNNIALDGPVSITGANAIQSNNTWNSGYSAGKTDFISIDTSLATIKRNTDGTLVQTDLFRLNSSSKLIDAGIDVGTPFYGKAPDIGAFEVVTTESEMVKRNYPGNQMKCRTASHHWIVNLGKTARKTFYTLYNIEGKMECTGLKSNNSEVAIDNKYLPSGKYVILLQIGEEKSIFSVVK